MTEHLNNSPLFAEIMATPVTPVELDKKPSVWQETFFKNPDLAIPSTVIFRLHADKTWSMQYTHIPHAYQANEQALLAFMQKHFPDIHTQAQAARDKLIERKPTQLPTKADIVNAMAGFTKPDDTKASTRKDKKPLDEDDDDSHIFNNRGMQVTGDVTQIGGRTIINDGDGTIHIGGSAKNTRITTFGKGNRISITDRHGNPIEPDDNGNIIGRGKGVVVTGRNSVYIDGDVTGDIRINRGDLDDDHDGDTHFNTLFNRIAGAVAPKSSSVFNNTDMDVKGTTRIVQGDLIKNMDLEAYLVRPATPKPHNFSDNSGFSWEPLKLPLDSEIDNCTIKGRKYSGTWKVFVVQGEWRLLQKVTQKK